MKAQIGPIVFIVTVTLMPMLYANRLINIDLHYIISIESLSSIQVTISVVAKISCQVY